MMIYLKISSAKCCHGTAFKRHGLTLIPTWTGNHISKVCDAIAYQITYPYQNLNDAAVEVWEWISGSITHLIMEVITYTCWD